MKLSQSLEALHRQMLQAWLNSSAEIGLSYSEFEYLCAVEAQESDENDDDESHGQHLHDVVAAMGVQKASASAMVIKLEGRKLLERVPCRYDARAQHILLTAEGRRLLAESRKIYAEAAGQIRSQLDKDTYRSVEHALAEILKPD
jgi:DNA-binding MarR family transcriptional regulator